MNPKGILCWRCKLFSSCEISCLGSDFWSIIQTFVIYDSLNSLLQVNINSKTNIIDRAVKVTTGKDTSCRFCGEHS